MKRFGRFAILLLFGIRKKQNGNKALSFGFSGCKAACRVFDYVNLMLSTQKETADALSMRQPF